MLVLWWLGMCVLEFPCSRTDLEQAVPDAGECSTLVSSNKESIFSLK